MTVVIFHLYTKINVNFLFRFVCCAVLVSELARLAMLARGYAGGLILKPTCCLTDGPRVEGNPVFKQSCDKQASSAPFSVQISDGYVSSIFFGDAAHLFWQSARGVLWLSGWAGSILCQSLAWYKWGFLLNKPPRLFFLSYYVHPFNYLPSRHPSFENEQFPSVVSAPFG